MKKLKISLYSTLALVMLSSCSQQNDTSKEQTSSETTSNSQTTSDNTPSITTDVTVEKDDVVASEADTSATPALGLKPEVTSAVEISYFGEVYDLYQGQSEKIDIGDFTLSEDGLEVEGGEITERLEDYLTLVMLADEKITPFYVTEETKFNEEVNNKDTWLKLLVEANELGFRMYPIEFYIEIVYSEDEFGNFYVDYADISTSEKYEDGPSVDTSTIDYTDTASVKIRYIFAVGDDLMTITTFEGERSDDSNDVEYRITENTGYSSQEASILDAQVKDAILANGSSLSDDLEMVCNLYWNIDDTHNNFQNLTHIELISFG